MNKLIAQNIRENRLVAIRLLIDQALADPGPLNSAEYMHPAAAKTSILLATATRKVAA